ncbi:MAG: hypothetical protein GY720_21440 [bacterium]|nr:hypothetical protein [bacterium]
MAFAREICAHWQENYGVPAEWGLEIGGDTGTVYWFVESDSLGDFEAQMKAAMSNLDTSNLLDTSTDLFQASPQEKLIVMM